MAIIRRPIPLRPRSYQSYPEKCDRAKAVRSAAARLLLPCHRQRELAVADAHRQPFGKARGGLLAVGRDELGESGKQAGLRQAIAIDAVKTGFVPGVVHIAERRAFLVAVPSGIHSRRCLNCHARAGCDSRGPPRDWSEYVSMGCAGGQTQISTRRALYEERLTQVAAGAQFVDPRCRLRTHSPAARW